MSLFLLRFFSLILLSLFLQGGMFAAQQNQSDQEKWRKALIMYQTYKKKSFSTAPEISVEKLLRWQKEKDIILVDVREKKERRISIIPGALSKKQFENNRKKYTDKKIVVYCTIGYRSGKYVQKLQKKKFTAYNLIGGILAWSHAGQKFAAPDGDSLRVHVYGKKWNLLPAGYHPVWK